MTRILSLLIAGLFTCFSIQAQTPQAVCYQAAAKDAQGVDLIGQDIAIRASIVRGNPSGPAQWEEIHTPTTDQFGLFAIHVGEGSPTGNGSLVDFSDIDWGDGTYWLRIEMDPNGGSDFNLMGATQIVSVPYALHAETAASADFADTANSANTAAFADSASVANFSQTAIDAQTAVNALNAQNAQTAEVADSAGVAGSASTANTALTALDDFDRDSLNELQELSLSDDCVLSISGGNSIDLKGDIFAASGASVSFPQGILGMPELLMDQTFIVPSGQNLYLTAAGPEITVRVGNTDVVHPTTPNMPILPPGTEIKNCNCTALLIDTQPELEAVVMDLNSTGGYTVPAGKTLYIKSGIPNSLPGLLILNGEEMEFLRPNLTRGSQMITLPENTTIQKPNLYDEMTLTGYLLSN